MARILIIIQYEHHMYNVQFTGGPGIPPYGGADVFVRIDRFINRRRQCARTESNGVQRQQARLAAGPDFAEDPVIGGLGQGQRLLSRAKNPLHPEMQIRPGA